MFLIAPLRCFYRLLFSFLLSMTTVLTTSTAHTCTYTVVRYCSIIELAPLLDEDEDPIISCFIKIQNGFTCLFLVLAYPDFPGKVAARWVSVLIVIVD